MKPSQREKAALHRRIRDLYYAGLVIREIAERLSVTKRLVTVVLTKVDAEARERRLSMERKEAELAASYRTERLGLSAPRAENRPAYGQESSRPPVVGLVKPSANKNGLTGAESDEALSAPASRFVIKR